MPAVEIEEGIFCLQTDVWTEDLFEGFWPIPDGVAINAYLVKGGDKVALVDLAREWGGNSSADFLRMVEAAGVSPRDVDYLVMNHLEPDHSGLARTMRQLAPNLEIYATKLGVRLVEAFFGISDGVHEVKTGDALDLGGGREFTFVQVPNVHWPDSMVTYEKQTKILFSSDAFGSFGALRGNLFDVDVPADQRAFYERETLRYYANIVASFSPYVLKAVDALAGVDLSMIAPAHGMLWKEPGEVVERYVRYAHYADGRNAKPKITIIYGSMYGNTQMLMNHLVRGINREGVEVEVFKMPNHDISYALASAWESAGLAVGMPTYERGGYPPVCYALDVLALKHVRKRKVLGFGSYGWSKGAKREFEERSKDNEWEVLDWLEFNGAPTSEDQRRAEDAGARFAREVKEFTKK
ncbi:MAG: FprA family A-type flavoprotein [Promethearchaeota archaeon]